MMLRAAWPQAIQGNLNAVMVVLRSWSKRRSATGWTTGSRMGWPLRTGAMASACRADHRVCRRYLTCVHGNRSLSVQTRSPTWELRRPHNLHRNPNPNPLATAGRRPNTTHPRPWSWNCGTPRWVAARTRTML